MIQFDNVSKKYPLGNSALENATFAIEPQEFVFFVGPSGAGKTTILKLLMKQIQPTSGSIFVNGTDIADKKFHDVLKLRRSIGMIFQDFKILYDRSVFENVALSLEVEEIGKKRIKKEVEEALSTVGILDKKLVFPVQLSAGELQRVAIARAVVGGRDIILGDEPTGNLDPKTSWDIMKIFKKLEENKTILIATHNVDVVNSFKKRVITLQDGKIIKDEKKGGYQL